MLIDLYRRFLGPKMALDNEIQTIEEHLKDLKKERKQYD
jgi:hypothetical protein